MKKLETELSDFAGKNGMAGKGPLSLALVVTRHAKKFGLPLDSKKLMAPSGGQVAGLGKTAVQSILSDHGIKRVLAEEGGRTSRGSVALMQKYVRFLNGLSGKGLANLDEIEKWWITQVRSFFSSKPFTLRLDSSKSLRSAVHDLLDQAEKRQRENPGTMFAGAVLQHLVGAKLEVLLPDITIEHFGSSVADEVSGRDSDFVIGEVAIHVTTAPGEAVIRKCDRNLQNDLSPLIVTTTRGALVAETLAEQHGIGGRIDIFDAEQFLAGNILELSKFTRSNRRSTVSELIDKYNQIMVHCETDPSLRIILGS